MKLIFGHFQSLLEKVKSAISELGTLKNRGFLRSINALAPVTWNDTRWTSLFHALNRYVKLHPVLTTEEGTLQGIKSKLLLPEEFQALGGLQKEFNILYSATEYLQGENCHMAHVRSLLNEIISRFGFIDGVENKLAARGDLVVDPIFESAIVKVLRGAQGSLDRNELKKLKPFEKRENLTEPRGQKRVNEVEEFLALEYENQKYIPLEHVPSTSVIVERAFSHSKIIFEPRRRSMTPFHLDLCLFLKFNRSLWSLEPLIDLT